MKTNQTTPKTERHALACTKKSLFKPIVLMHLLALSLFLMSSKCGKENPPPEEPKLPPATQTGANTFGCKVNGEIWLPKGAVNFPEISEPSYHQLYGAFGFRSNNVNFEPRQKVYVEVDSCFQAGQFPLVPNQQYFSGYDKYFYPDTSGENWIKISLIYTTNKIFSGTFNYFLISEDGLDTLSITEGRFDVGNVNVY